VLWPLTGRSVSWWVVGRENCVMATTVVPIEGMLDAYEQVAYRTTITALMTA